jgi:hypothetical protein
MYDKRYPDELLLSTLIFLFRASQFLSLSVLLAGIYGRIRVQEFNMEGPLFYITS